MLYTKTIASELRLSLTAMRPVALSFENRKLRRSSKRKETAPLPFENETSCV